MSINHTGIINFHEIINQTREEIDEELAMIDLTSEVEEIEAKKDKTSIGALALLGSLGLSMAGCAAVSNPIAIGGGILATGIMIGIHFLSGSRCPDMSHFE